MRNMDNDNKGAVIFYQPIEKSNALDSQSGTSIRPKELKNAFKKSGFEIIDINGSTKQRRKQMNHALEKRDVKYLYIESANIPMSLSNKEHWKVSITDLINLKKATKQMKVGFFYRDAHWRYDEYLSQVGLLKGSLLKFLFYFEFIFLRRTVDYIFIPTEGFEKLLPDVKGKALFKALPPAVNTKCKNRFSIDNESINILYSGNVANEGTYDITKLIENIIDVNCELYLNVPLNSWEKYKNGEMVNNFKNIFIQHYTYNEMVYEDIDVEYNIGIIYLSLPQKIQEAVMPIKLFQYIGMGLPIICVGKSAYADFVIENDIGWQVDSCNDLRDLLHMLEDNKNEIVEKHRNVLKIQESNSWEARVAAIDELLSEV